MASDHINIMTRILPNRVTSAVTIFFKPYSFTVIGSGSNYLWFRIPLQVLFIAWTYLTCIK
jgi:hypothetical protein